MESFLLSVANYLTNQNAQTMDTFFENGINFPQLIAQSLQIHVEDIPNVKISPRNSIEKNQNNIKSLDYLLTKNTELKKIGLDITKRKTLLFWIITKQIFTMKSEQIVTISNTILESLKIRYNSFNDLVNEHYLISLLNILTDQKVKTFDDINDYNSDSILSNSFEMAKVPLFVTRNFFKNYPLKRSKSDDLTIFSIQIQIILNIYSEKVKSFQGQIQSIEKQVDQTKQEKFNLKKIGPKIFTEDNNDYDYDFDDENEDNFDDKLTDGITMSLPSEDIDFEKTQTDPLLNIINFLTDKMVQKELNFTKFSKTLKNDFVPLFVMKLLNISSIPNIDKLSNNNNNNNKFTIQNKENFYAVIDFLKKKEKTFQFFIFSFKTFNERNYSAKLFFSNFLNFFFIKSSKEEMCTRGEALIGDFQYYKGFSMTKYGLILLGLTRLISKIKKNKSKLLLIFDISSIKSINQIELLPDPYFYQLQILLDEWDEGPLYNTKIIERLLISKYKLKKINVPKFDIIASSIMAKRSYLIYTKTKKIVQPQHIKKPEYLSFKKTDSQSINIQRITRYISTEIEFNEIYNFWNESNTYNFIYNNGLMIRKSRIKYSSSFFEKQFPHEKLLQSDRKSSIRISKIIDEHYKLYKIFIYDEQKLEWKFNSNELKKLSNDHNISLNNSSVPLVFYINSKEDDLITINNNFIISKFPIIEGHNDIFVYGITDKNLNSLHYMPDFQNKVKSSIQPIFLILHVPKTKAKTLKNIDLVIFQIHFYLSCICNLGIVVLDHDYAQDQIEYLKSIVDLSQLSISQEKFKKINYRFDQNAINDEKEIIFKKMDVIFLFNTSDSKSYNNINEEIKEINLETSYILFQINDFGYYNEFLKTLSSKLIKNSSIFSEVRQNFNSISLIQVCMKYIQSRKEANWKTLLKEYIEKRYSMLEKQKKSPINSIKQIYNELCKFTPKIDNDFISEYQKILISLRKNLNDVKDILKTKLLESSTANCLKIMDNLSKATFITDELECNMIRYHINFLEKEFFELIKLISYENISENYEDNLEILESQINQDKEKLKKYCNICQENAEKEKSIININEDIDNGTNYILKETENLREVEITIEKDGQLTDAIPQDF